PSSSLFPYTTLFRSGFLARHLFLDRRLQHEAAFLGLGLDRLEFLVAGRQLLLRRRHLTGHRHARREELRDRACRQANDDERLARSEEHTSELQSPYD